MTESLDELVKELARVLKEPQRAQLVAEQAGLPGGDLLAFTSARMFWARVVDDASMGMNAGGVRAIVECATELYPHNGVFQRYLGSSRPSSPPRRRVRVLPLPLLERLLEVVNGVEWPKKELGHTYRRCRSSRGHDGTATIADMVNVLATLGWSGDDTHPVLAFARRLVALTRDHDRLRPIGPKIAQWFEEASDELGCHADACDALIERIEAEAAAPTELHLVLILDGKFSTNGYHVRGYRILARKEWDHWDCDDAEPLELDPEPRAWNELPALLGRACALIADDIRDCEDQLTIEIFVPRELLLCDADRWPVSLGGYRLPSGASWRMVLRDWRRSYDLSVHDTLVPKWEDLWSRRAPYVPDEGIYTLAPSGHIVPPFTPAATAIFAFVPPRDHATGKHPILEEVLSKGTSIAVWPRNGQLPQGCLQEVIQRIREKPVEGWPDLVKTCRYEASASTDAPDAHLTMLWDDPNKLPPDALGRGRAEQLQKAKP